jgi:molybdenum cofactor cytidylyltransferase
VRVVTGFAADDAEACLAGLDIAFTHNPDHPTGMASSLRCGLAALDADAMPRWCCWPTCPSSTATTSTA